MYLKLSKMVHNILAVPITGVGVEQEFSISERIVIR